MKSTTNTTKLISSIGDFFKAPFGDKCSIIEYVTIVIMGLLTWIMMFALFEKEAKPGGRLFMLIALFVSCYISGWLVSLIKLPPLLGMLICGLVLENLGLFRMYGVYEEIVVGIRDIALTTILLTAGLGLDAGQLKTMSFAVIKLAFVPCIAEATAVSFAAYFLLNMPILWGLLLGFVLSAVSPAVVVPSLLKLKKEGYGEDKGISTLVIAASSIDDIICISIFGVLLGLIFSYGDLVQNILHGPIEVLGGGIVGIVWGFIAACIPHRNEKHLAAKRTFMIGGGAFVVVFLSTNYGYSGIGPLAVIISSFIASHCWKLQGWTEQNPVSDFFKNVWIMMQPLLFGLIGAEVRINQIEPALIGQGVGVLCFGLIIRMLACLSVMCGTGLNLKEMFFINLSWLPKATIQATLGPRAFDLATKQRIDFEYLGREVLTVAVLSILITAPLGAIGIMVGGRNLLNKVPKRADVENIEESPPNRLPEE